jgi:hypothetical protein
MIINLKQKQQPKRLTFGDVPENALFVTYNNSLWQKTTFCKARIICRNKILFGGGPIDWNESDEIREILPITGFDY